MSSYIDEILMRSIDYMKNNHTDTVALRSRNQDELLNFIVVLPQLIDEGFIIPISKNYRLTKYDVINDTLFKFRLTSKAMDYCKSQNLK